MFFMWRDRSRRIPAPIPFVSGNQAILKRLERLYVDVTSPKIEPL